MFSSPPPPPPPPFPLSLSLRLLHTHTQHDIVAGVPTENLLSTILEALAEPTVSYIGLGYDTTVSLNTGEQESCMCDTRTAFACATLTGEAQLAETVLSAVAHSCTYTCTCLAFYCHVCNALLFFPFLSVLYNSEPDPRLPVLSEFMRSKALVSRHMTCHMTCHMTYRMMFSRLLLMPAGGE